MFQSLVSALVIAILVIIGLALLLPVLAKAWQNHKEKK